MNNLMRLYRRATAVALLTYLLAVRASAAVVAQCEAADGDAVTNDAGCVLAWTSIHGGAALVPALPDSPAWALPSLTRDGIAFDASDRPASPLASEGSSISTLFLVADPAFATNDFATLVEVLGASVTAAPRAVPQTYDPEDAAGLSVRVNGMSSLTFPAAPHIVEVDFAGLFREATSVSVASPPVPRGISRGVEQLAQSSHSTCPPMCLSGKSSVVISPVATALQAIFSRPGTRRCFRRNRRDLTLTVSFQHGCSLNRSVKALRMKNPTCQTADSLGNVSRFTEEQMVKIRLRRTGCNNTPSFRVVATDERSPATESFWRFSAGTIPSGRVRISSWTWSAWRSGSPRAPS
jgi:hypothetical protein